MTGAPPDGGSGGPGGAPEPGGPAPGGGGAARDDAAPPATPPEDSGGGQHEPTPEPTPEADSHRVGSGEEASRATRGLGQGSQRHGHMREAFANVGAVDGDLVGGDKYVYLLGGRQKRLRRLSPLDEARVRNVYQEPPGGVLDDARQQLERQRLLILRGPDGYGKSAMAMRLLLGMAEGPVYHLDSDVDFGSLAERLEEGGGGGIEPGAGYLLDKPTDVRNLRGEVYSKVRGALARAGAVMVLTVATVEVADSEVLPGVLDVPERPDRRRIVDRHVTWVVGDERAARGILEAPGFPELLQEQLGDEVPCSFAAQLAEQLCEAHQRGDLDPAYVRARLTRLTAEDFEIWAEGLDDPRTRGFALALAVLNGLPYEFVSHAARLLLKRLEAAGELVRTERSPTVPKARDPFALPRRKLLERLRAEECAPRGTSPDRAPWGTPASRTAGDAFPNRATNGAHPNHTANGAHPNRASHSATPIRAAQGVPPDRGHRGAPAGRGHQGDTVGDEDAALSVGIRYKDPDYPVRVIRHTWAEYGVHDVVLDWLGELVSEGVEKVPVYAAVAAGVLAQGSYTYVAGNALHRWAFSGSPELRQAAAIALVLACRSGRHKEAIGREVRRWYADTDEPMGQATAARAYGFNHTGGDPAVCVAALARLTSVNHIVVAVAVGSALTDLLTDDSTLALTVLEALLGRLEELRSRPAALLAFLIVAAEWTVPEDGQEPGPGEAPEAAVRASGTPHRGAAPGADGARPGWPVLLCLAHTTPSLQRPFALLWRAALGQAFLRKEAEQVLRGWAALAERDARLRAMFRDMTGALVYGDPRVGGILRRCAEDWTHPDALEPLSEAARTVREVLAREGGQPAPPGAATRVAAGGRNGESGR